MMATNADPTFSVRQYSRSLSATEATQKDPPGESPQKSPEEEFSSDWSGNVHKENSRLDPPAEEFPRLTTEETVQEHFSGWNDEDISSQAASRLNIQGMEASDESAPKERSIRFSRLSFLIGLCTSLVGVAVGAAVVATVCSRPGRCGNPEAASAPVSSPAPTIMPTEDLKWQQLGELLGPRDRSDSYFGFDVAINDRGNIIAIGSPSEPTSTGYADTYKYSEEESVWQLDARIEAPNEMAPDETDFSFGRKVSLSDDGTNLMVLSAGSDDNEPRDYVQVFSSDLGSWVHDGGEDRIVSVDMSGNGKYLALGLAGANNVGIAETYIIDTDFPFGEPIVVYDDTNETNFDFGRSVAMSSNGETMVVGAKGFARIYQYGGFNWLPSPRQVPDSTSVYSLNFGAEVAVSNDGRRVAVFDSSNFGGMGSVTVWEQVNGGNWTQVGAPIRQEQLRLLSMSLSGDGTTLAAVTERSLLFYRADDTGDWFEEPDAMDLDVSNRTRCSLSYDGATVVCGQNFDDESPGRVSVHWFDTAE